MAWKYREELSHSHKIRRSYYELLRDDLDQFMINHALIDSYQNFIGRGIPYPFVERRELKPRGRVPSFEHECQNSFLVIFVEDMIPQIHKKYIRYFDDNKTTKTNLLKVESLPLDDFDRTHKNLDSAHFFDFMKKLLSIDYALLIQCDPASKVKNRYALSHFHVRIDWPIAEASEDLAKNLRYISKDLYEKGDKLAEDLQKKYFEYYGLPLMVGGRRTGAIVAAQYLKRIPFISTVYVGSSESRALLRICERGVTRSTLVKFNKDEQKDIAESHGISLTSFTKNYVVATEGRSAICIFQVYYDYSGHARPPFDGKLRELNPDLHWLTISNQQIIPKPGVFKHPPLGLNWIYS